MLSRISAIDPLGAFRPFWYDAAKSLYRFFTEAEFRRYLWLILRYGRTPRYTKCSIAVRGWNLVVPDVASFLSAYREIFVEEIYALPALPGEPAFLDCGANIGLSVLYLREKHPGAAIVAYEADPLIFDALRTNIESNGVTGIELHPYAVWTEEGTIDFSREGADGGRINTGNDDNIISIPAKSLSGILQGRRFDFVKFDIEGAEVQVIKSCEALVDRSDFVFIEFHSFQGRRQELGWLIDVMERGGFRVHVHPPFISQRPFLGITGRGGMDMQLNLFFWKDTHETA